jgi:hypothetical protein
VPFVVYNIPEVSFTFFNMVTLFGSLIDPAPDEVNCGKLVKCSLLRKEFEGHESLGRVQCQQPLHVFCWKER